MMKIFTYRRFLLCAIFFISCESFGISSPGSDEEAKYHDYLSIFLNSIEICRWKEDATACVNFSFDDGCRSQNKISRIFDDFGFRASFFVIANSMMVDSIKDMALRRHEIGNHTYSHDIPFSRQDSVSIDFQIRKANEMIENALKIKCVSFGEPWHNSTTLSRRLAGKYLLFDRDYSKYQKYNRLDMGSELHYPKITSYINNGLKNKSMLILCGHGIDGDGWSPIRKDLLVQTLSFTKRYADDQDLWVTTLKEAQHYENLYHELTLGKEVCGDTLKLIFRNYDRKTYAVLDSSPISVEMPTFISEEITLMADTDHIRIRKRPGNFVITADLKEDTSVILLVKGLKELVPRMNKKFNETCSIYPNPAKDILSIICDGDISSIEIFNSKGTNLLKKYDRNMMDVSDFSRGIYLMKAYVRRNSQTFVYEKKFLKW